MFWITGSRGLLGSALSAKCKSPLTTGRELDISDRPAVFAFVKNNPGITHIINCAAFSQVDAAESCREEAYKANALGPENLALAAKEIGAKLIHISTDYVFSGRVHRPLSEDDPPDPSSYYGKTKLEGEKKALEHSACVIRTSWIFGSGGKNFVSKLLKMIQLQKEIRLTDDQYGRFTYAPDLADAILLMLEEASLLGFPIVAESIVPVPQSFFQAPCERPAYSALDTTKIEAFMPIRHWRNPLKDFLCEQLPAYL
jgi:dTDP-4-dehydrorhamnose reductase